MKMFDLQKLTGSREKLNAYVWEAVSGAKTMEDVLSRGLEKLFMEGMPKAVAWDMCSIVKRLPMYTYEQSSYRRSCRSGNPRDYYGKLCMLAGDINFEWKNFDILSYLTMSDAQKKEQNYKNPNWLTTAYLIALKIDQGDKSIIDAVSDIMISESNAIAVDYNLIRAVAASHNAGLHELMKNLLLAARLQEGLRQAILESADDGVLDFFTLMIKTVLENDLLRYSSALRAVCTWMGLGYEYSDKRNIEKLLRLALTYMEDDGERAAAIGSEDVAVMFAAMWAESNFSIENLHTQIEQNMRGAQYQKLVGAYFLFETGSQESKTRIAGESLVETDLDVLALVHRNYSLNLGNVTDGYNSWRSETDTRTLNTGKYPECLNDRSTRDRHFSLLAETIGRIPKGGHKVIGKPFDWCSCELTQSAVYSSMMTLAAYDMDEGKILRLMELFALVDGSMKSEFLRFFISKDISGEKRAFLFTCLTDKGMPVRVLAAKMLKKITLDEAETIEAENLLTLKTGEIRQIALEVLRDAGDAAALASAKRLIADKNDNKRLAALDLLSALKKSGAVQAGELGELFGTMPKKTEAETILMDSLLDEGAAEYSEENGFGLYDPGYWPELPPVARDDNYAHQAFRKISLKDVKKVTDSLIALIEEHKDYEYKAIHRLGGAEDRILGNSQTLDRVTEWEDGRDSKMDDYALGAVWGEWFEKNRDQAPALVKILYCDDISWYNGKYELKGEPFVQELIKDYFGFEDIAEICAWKTSKKYFRLVCSIVNMLLRLEADSEETFAFHNNVLADIFLSLPEEDWSKPCFADNVRQRNSTTLAGLKEIKFFIDRLRANTRDEYEKKLSLCYAIGKASDAKTDDADATGSRFIALNNEDVAYAVTNGLVDKNEIFHILVKKNGGGNMRFFTRTPLQKNIKEFVEKYPIVAECVQDIVKRVIEIELKRGDIKTPVSELANNIQRHEGAEVFAEILVALGKETLARGYVWGGDFTKHEVLSSLLKANVPAKGDDAKTLEAALRGRVSEKRLLEAVMYSPSWIAIAEDYLGWKGLKSGAWYFHAHTRSSYSAEFETEVARFSPIEKEDFQRGAFDILWFKDALKTLGEKRFEILYDCAKYISDGGTHRRAQLFADAVLGKLKLDELEPQIRDKRNKDLLMSYSLVPLSGDRTKAALRRYEFINEFLKKSRQFGAQRQASEKEAAGIALENLARNLGYADVLRFNWKMEMEKLDVIRDFFTPRAVGDTELFLEMDETGMAGLVVEKAGKRLKSVPAAIKKDEYVKEIGDVKNSLKAQFSRARASLEKEMENRDSLTFGEVSELRNHPVISPIIKKLVFRSGDGLGFLGEDGLVQADGPGIALKSGDEVRIAHCYDLFTLGKWHDYQRFAFDNSLVQPFKQIFRELYTVNDDEKSERVVSRRYAGNQIQPKMAVALLKGRGWTVDYENGLQKVYYKENVIAAMYALADWFSPAEIEAPTLETVRFYDRKTYGPLEFASLDPVLFSEVMRDVDLVVSVAHVGGVDPMASHSTIEMRSVIVAESARLLKLGNVTVTDRHAKIQGALGEYSVHLGSGIAHMAGRGALNILPVHSQHRGRLFLPFMDDDPKTAEIVSKVLLLAEDEKIKDPTVMSQIK